MLCLQEVGSEKGRALWGLQWACWRVGPRGSPALQTCRVNGQEGALAGPDLLSAGRLCKGCGARGRQPGCVPVVAQRHTRALLDRLGESGWCWSLWSPATAVNVSGGLRSKDGGGPSRAGDTGPGWSSGVSETMGMHLCFWGHLAPPGWVLGQHRTAEGPAGRLGGPAGALGWEATERLPAGGKGARRFEGSGPLGGQAPRTPGTAPLTGPLAEPAPHPRSTQTHHREGLGGAWAAAVVTEQAAASASGAETGAHGRRHPSFVGTRALLRPFPSPLLLL